MCGWPASFVRTRDIAVLPLVPPDAQVGVPAPPPAARHRRASSSLRSWWWTCAARRSLPPARLPYDSVFILGRFVSAVSAAVMEAGGVPNQFLGDGVLAIFGLHCDPRTACRQAVAAAGLVARNIRQLSAALADELPGAIEFGVGVHCGSAVVGEIGFRDHVVFTALGDVPNVASRLEGPDQGAGVRGGGVRGRAAHRRDKRRWPGAASGTAARPRRAGAGAAAASPRARDRCRTARRHRATQCESTHTCDPRASLGSRPAREAATARVSGQARSACVTTTGSETMRAGVLAGLLTAATGLLSAQAKAAPDPHDRVRGRSRWPRCRSPAAAVSVGGVTMTGAPLIGSATQSICRSTATSLWACSIRCRSASPNST